MIAGDEADLGAQAREGKESGEEHHHHELLQLVSERAGQHRVVRDDGAQQERAKQGMDADVLRRHAGEEEGDAHRRHHSLPRRSRLLVTRDEPPRQRPDQHEHEENVEHGQQGRNRRPMYLRLDHPDHECQ